MTDRFCHGTGKMTVTEAKFVVNLLIIQCTPFFSINYVGVLLEILL